MLKKTKDHSVIRNIKTAQRRPGYTDRRFELVDIPGGFKAAVQVELPENINKTQKYPVIVEVYGGPEFQESIWLFYRNN